MNVDIDKLNEVELRELNHRIVKRLRFLREAHAEKEMLKFKLGDQVYFETDSGTKIKGMLTRHNKKTVTLITEDGQQWNILPQLLKRQKGKKNGFDELFEEGFESFISSNLKK